MQSAFIKWILGLAIKVACIAYPHPQKIYLYRLHFSKILSPSACKSHQCLTVICFISCMLYTLHSVNMHRHTSQVVVIVAADSIHFDDIAQPSDCSLAHFVRRSAIYSFYALSSLFRNTVPAAVVVIIIVIAVGSVVEQKSPPATLHEHN